MCVEFYTSMYGNDIGELQVLSSGRGKGNEWESFTNKDSSGDTWNRQTTDVTLFNENERVNCILCCYLFLIFQYLYIDYS